MYSLVHRGLNVLKVGICVEGIEERQHSLKHHLVLLLKYRTHNSTQLLSSPQNDSVPSSGNTLTGKNFTRSIFYQSVIAETPPTNLWHLELTHSLEDCTDTWMGFTEKS